MINSHFRILQWVYPALDDEDKIIIHAKKLSVSVTF